MSTSEALKCCEMSMLNILAGVLHLAAVKVKSYSKDTAPTDIQQRQRTRIVCKLQPNCEKDFYLGFATSSCVGSGSHCQHQHQLLVDLKQSWVLQSISSSNPAAIASTLAIGGLQVTQVFPDAVAVCCPIICWWIHKSHKIGEWLLRRLQTKLSKEAKRTV